MADQSPVTDPQSASLPSAAGIQSVPNNPIAVDNDNARILARQTTSGVSKGVQQFGTPNLYADSGANQIVVAETVGNTTTNQVLMGRQSTFGDGFYVSKPGIAVDTATSAADFIFNSNQNVFKIIITGTVSFNKAANSTGASAQIAHGLDFAPLIIAYFTDGTFYYPVGSVGVAFTGLNSGKITRVSSLSTDTTYVYFGVSTPDWAGNGNYQASEDYTIKYYLLQETAN